jgi:hypothetical protein
LSVLALTVALSSVSGTKTLHARRSPVPLPAEGALEEGDLVFRRGSSPLSRFVLGTDAVAAYSHVGILAVVGGRLQVVHVSVGEGGPASDRTRADPLSTFLSPDRAEAWAVYRLRREAERLGPLAAEGARRYLSDGRTFDAAFDLQDDTRLYCTELVWRSYRAAGLDLAPAQLETFALLGTRAALPISRVALSPELALISSYTPPASPLDADPRGAP